MRASPLAALALLIPILCGCAPRTLRVGAPEVGRTEARYREALAAREAARNGIVAELSLWLEAQGTRYPGVRATLEFGGERSLRLVVDSAFGVGLDAAAVGDSVYAWAPARRAAVRAASAEPPVEFPHAARFAVRAASAAWPVPAAAWRAARAADSLWIVRFTEGADTLEVGIGESGLPRTARLSRPGMRPIEVAYSAYMTHAGTAWPERIDARDTGGAFRLNLRVRRIMDGGAGEPWRPDYPAGTRMVEPGDVMRWIDID